MLAVGPDLDAERDQIARGPGEDLTEQVRVALEPGHLSAPRGGRIVGVWSEYVAEGRMHRLQLAWTELERDVELALPPAARRQVDHPGQAVIVDARRRIRDLDRRLRRECPFA